MHIKLELRRVLRRTKLLHLSLAQFIQVELGVIIVMDVLESMFVAIVETLHHRGHLKWWLLVITLLVIVIRLEQRVRAF